MRREPVATEELFWNRIRNRKLGGFKFKRQFPIDPYIVDFVCLEKKLIVELDGSLHDDQIAYDEGRDRYLESNGYRVMRFENGEVVEYLSTVLEAILQALKTPSPQPSPPLRGGEGVKYRK
jgi:very-short-patch-repair endonuclease